MCQSGFDFWQNTLRSATEHVVHRKNVCRSGFLSCGIDEGFKDLQIQCGRGAIFRMPLHAKAEPVIFN